MSEFAKAWANEGMPSEFEYVTAYGLSYVNRLDGVEIEINSGWWNVRISGRHLKTKSGRLRSFRSPLAALRAITA